MTNYLSSGAIHVRDIALWSHVGVLDQEQLLGQKFLLDFSLWLDLDHAAIKDDLKLTADYSLAISQLQELAFQCKCLTIEHFSERILNELESIYGAIPMQVKLRKCNAPVAGFSGVVEVERSRFCPT